MDTWKKYVALLLICIALLAIFIIEDKPAQKQFYTDAGYVFGTTYHITYEADTPLTADIHAALRRVDNSLSMFNKKSTITAVNRNDTTVVLDTLFIQVFNKSREISEATHGAFDITVAPLVNLWGFGFDKRSLVTPDRLDSAFRLIGYRKVTLDNGKIIKSDPDMMLDASAIAKGFACDVVAETLTKHNIENYLVEIGGEVAVNGHNAKNEAWRIGINKPVEDSLSVTNEIQQVAILTRGGMATSGNYRNFYVENGKKLAHTIDPLSGYPVQHSLLSATIVANDCMTADACATACMVMGLDSSLNFCRQYGLAGYFIYADNDTFGEIWTDNFPIKQ
ncbi:MAG: FAD:protein FMN transferase [Paludibacteraceae bacterium]